MQEGLRESQECQEKKEKKAHKVVLVIKENRLNITKHFGFEFFADLVFIGFNWSNWLSGT